jgi:hypothetical protein
VPANADFNIADADALLELIYSKPTGRLVVVAGQAVNFWADRYSAREPRLALLQPFTSRDLDLLGTLANAIRLAKEAHAPVEQPPQPKSGASLVVANVKVETGNFIRSVQFLRHVRGVTNDEITQNAIPFTIGEVTVHFADPITMLKAKLHNVVELEQKGRQDAKHIEVLCLCIPFFLSALLTAADKTDEAARESLRTIQRVLRLSESPIARRIPAKIRFDWTKLIPVKRLEKVRNSRLKNFLVGRQFEQWRSRFAGRPE